MVVSHSREKEHEQLEDGADVCQDRQSLEASGVGKTGSSFLGPQV